jgi:Ribbon-helix-helix domain
MTIDQIFTQPITTPAFPDPAAARRYIDDPDGFYGHDYVFLEDAAWHALCEIAHERGCTVDELCADIDLIFAPGEDFAPAARRVWERFAELRVPNPPDFLVFIADELAERRKEIAALHTLQKRLETLARRDGQQIPADTFGAAGTVEFL